MPCILSHVLGTYLHRLLYDIFEYLINILLQIGSLKVKTQHVNPMKILFF